MLDHRHYGALTWYLAPFKMELVTGALPSLMGTAFFCYVAIEPGAALAVVNAFSPSSTHFELKLRMALLWRLAGGFIAVIQLCGFTMIFGPVLHGLSACRRYGWRHLFGIGRVHRSVDPGVLV